MTEAARPSSIEAEQAVLGGILLDNDLLDRLPEGFSAEMFYEPIHGHIFTICAWLIGRGKLASAITLKPYLSAHEGLGELGGVDYLARMVGAVVSLPSTPEYAEMVRDLWARRETIRELEVAMAEIATFDEREAADHISRTQKALDGVSARLETGPPFHTLGEAITEAVDFTNEAFQRDGEPLIGFGLQPLDELTGGLHPEDHVVLMGESSMGKTALALSFAEGVIEGGRSVFFASLEMGRREIANRLLSARLWRQGDKITYFNMRSGQLTEEQFRKVLEAGRDMPHDAMLFAPDRTTTLQEIRRAVTRAHQSTKNTDRPLGLIVCDYLQLIGIPDADSATQRVSAAAIGMKQLAKSMGVPVLSLSQMNQSNRGRDNKRPEEGDARQSGEIRESADIMIGMFREAHYLQREVRSLAAGDPKRSEAIAEMHLKEHHLEAIILKQRHGPLETAHLWADLKYNIVLGEAPDKRVGQSKLDFE